MSNRTLKTVIKAGAVASAAAGATEASIKAGYWVCEKSDGDRMMLFCKPGFDGAFLINRSFVVSRINGGEAIAKAIGSSGATLLDGELLIELGSNSPMYMVFDAISVQGVSCRDRPLFDRLTAIGQSVVKPWKSFEQSNPGYSGLKVAGKAFFPASRVERVFARIKSTEIDGKHVYVYHGDHGSNLNDGVVFTPGSSGYWQPKDTLLKWKWFEDNTVDFVVDNESLEQGYKGTDANGEYAIELKAWCGRGADGERFNHVGVAHAHVSRAKFEEIAALVQTLPTLVVECGYDVEASTWKPKCYRKDKRKANYVRIAFHTMEVMAENIAKQDLIRQLAPGAT